MSGFTRNASGLTITKDTDAELTYTFDWSQWLDATDTILSSSYEVQARANDPRPLLVVTSGNTDTETYVTLSEGQTSKWYTVTASITTANGLVDRRNFRMLIENRSA